MSPLWLGLCILSLISVALGSTNVTSLTGTWSTGTGAVQTGPNFANPVNFTFNYPATTGVSYSFTDDGYFEEAQYRFNSNGSKPLCIQGIVIYQHGKYELLANGSIVLTPFGEDGRIQVQEPCAAKSNVITYFNQTELFGGWDIYADTKKQFRLQLSRFDGSLMAPMYLYANPPTMLPTQVLSANVSASAFPDNFSGAVGFNPHFTAYVAVAASLGAVVLGSMLV